MEDLLNCTKWEEQTVLPHQTDLMLSDLVSIIDDGGRERQMENQSSNLGLDNFFLQKVDVTNVDS